MNSGDILGIQGRGWLSGEIRKCTGDGPLSHVGVCTALHPIVQITEALTRVRTRPLDISLADADHAWAITPLHLTDEQRTEIVTAALSFSADDYGYIDIALQLADSVAKTRWFTQNWAERKLPICSMLDSMAYKAAGIDLGVSSKSVTPNDIWDYAVLHPEKFTISPLK